MQAAADLADGGLERYPKPSVLPNQHANPVCDHLRAGPLLRARGEQGAQPGIGRERAAQLGEVLTGEAAKERAGAL